MVIHFLGFAAGLGVIVAGAHFLVRGASGIALHFGLSRLVVGLTVVAFGTSSPELAVSLKAALGGNGGIAIGNIVGSNIFNIAVVLGLSALIVPLVVHLQIIRWDVPIMLAVTALFVFFAIGDGVVRRWEGAVLFAGIIAYTVTAVRMARREVKAAVEYVPATTVETVAEDPAKLLRCAGLTALGLALLTGGSELLVRNAVALAEAWGVGPAVIGLTIVAAGTSLPELATSIVAAFRRETDLAVGNIVGSNIFNLLCIGGAAGLASPIAAGGIGWLDLGAMALTSLLLLPLMRTGFRIVRWEGALLLAIYAGYLFLRWPRS